MMVRKTVITFAITAAIGAAVALAPAVASARGGGHGGGGHGGGFGGDTAVVLAEAAFVAVGLGVVDSTAVRLAVSAAGLVDSVGPRLVAASVELGLAVFAVS
jgi:hypothetical protein